MSGFSLIFLKRSYPLITYELLRRQLYGYSDKAQDSHSGYTLARTKLFSSTSMLLTRANFPMGTIRLVKFGCEATTEMPLPLLDALSFK